MADSGAIVPDQNRNEQFGLILFIISEAVMFGSFFAQYFYNRVLASAWPPQNDPIMSPLGISLLLTIFLAVSAFTAHNAQIAAQKGDRDSLTGWLIVTIVLGLCFIGGQGFEYANLLGPEHFGINSDIYGTVFFSLTGLHGLHVIAGIVVLTGVLIRAFMGHFSSRNHFAVDGAILYWHFVDVVWVALYLSLYIFSH